MTGEQVVRVVRAVARHLIALADDLEQITTAQPEPQESHRG